MSWELNRDILFSIKPKYVHLILEGKKTIEVRKTRCKSEPKFRGFIYCTNDLSYTLWKCDVNAFARGRAVNRPELNCNGRIVCHCTIPVIDEYKWDSENVRYDIDDDTLAKTCLTQEDLIEYGRGKTLYGYHLEYVMPYCGPVRIEEAWAWQPYKEELMVKTSLKRSPQSWCYVSGVGLLE